MSKEVSTKKIMIMIGAAVLVIAAAVVIFILNHKNGAESFRSIMVYDLQGSALIQRRDIGGFSASENIYLESGDRVLVDEDSLMRLKLDNDKYITAESDTVFTLEAEGDEEDSKTRIYLEQGSIISEIQNPLSSESIYETVTPNAVMAVRGTVFRVELHDDGEGGLDTRMSCFSGTVATIPTLSDGTSGEEVMVSAGNEIIVHEDGTTSEIREIDYDTFPVQAIETLSALDTEIHADLIFTASSEATDVSGSAHSSEGNLTADDDSHQSYQGENTDSVSDDEEIGIKKTGAGKRQDDAEVGEDTAETEEIAEQPKAESHNAALVNGGDSGIADIGRESVGEEVGNKDDDDVKDSSEVRRYTVTFIYAGSTFATQTVPAGKTVVEPKLVPDLYGKWGFDFSTPITGNTTIEWIPN